MATKRVAYREFVNAELWNLSLRWQ